jgi:hypothetical protein
LRILEEMFEVCRLSGRAFLVCPDSLATFQAVKPHGTIALPQRERLLDSEAPAFHGASGCFRHMSARQL